MLYRAHYLRKSTPVSITFASDGDSQAVEFARRWERMTQLPVLALKRIGRSKFTKSLKRR